MMRPEDRRDIYRICDVINESHDDILSNLKFDEICKTTLETSGEDVKLHSRRVEKM